MAIALDPELYDLAAALSQTVGRQLGGGYAALADGANNQVFRLETSRRPLLLKVYFQDPGDVRDRLGAEWSFVNLAWNHGVRAIPKPIAMDRQAGIALYEFIAGRKLNLSEIDRQAVCSAIEFCSQLKPLRQLPAAAELNDGSEACFTFKQHLRCVERRIRSLGENISAASDIDRAAVEFVEKELSPTAQALLQESLHAAEALGIQIDEHLPSSQRVISPSDFGFHNALLANDGRIQFIDFEYAGWDDPAKLICDFFCQPQRPVSLNYYGAFAAEILKDSSHLELDLRRTDLLLPVYRLKWCCIMLNDFLAIGRRRRRYSSPGDENRRKSNQLEKARQALSKLTQVHLQRPAA